MKLFDYLGHDTRADGATALSNGEPEALIHGDRLDQLDLHLGVLTRSHELAALGELDDARHVAIATVANLSIVVSWNHRHLANENKKVLFNSVNRLHGYEPALAIHTPFEVMQ